MMNTGKNVAAAFVMSILVAALVGCDKPEAAKENTGKSSVKQAEKSTARSICSECGVIDSIREVSTKGKGTGVGVVGGAVVGGLLGNQVGGGKGKDAATVVGAVGGAVVGNKIEESARSTTSYEITIRFEDGSRRTIHESNASGWRVGDRVRVVNGAIRSNN